MPRPPFIVSTAAVVEEPGRYPQSDEVLSYGRAIGKAAGLQRVGLHVERLPPGHRTSYPHAEWDEEEFVFVLEGHVDAWIDGALHPMGKGDLAAFPAGTGICHSFLNNGTAEALLLVGGEKGKAAWKIFYPLNPERRAQIAPESWWEDVPPRPRGDHDGRAGSRIGARVRAWIEQLRADGVTVPPSVDVWCFGGDDAMSRQLADLVITGTKTATCAMLAEFTAEGLAPPRPGDLSIVTDPDGAPRCLIEHTETTICPFREVDAAFAAEEGEGDRSLAHWRACHAAYFTAQARILGCTFDEQTLLVNQRFRLLRVA